MILKDVSKFEIFLYAKIACLWTVPLYKSWETNFWFLQSLINADFVILFVLEIPILEVLVLRNQTLVWIAFCTKTFPFKWSSQF